ncbi:MAG: Fic family protein [Chitinophagales bacterium]
MKELIKKIEQNQETIANYGKIDLSILNKINYKIRLDWNYYSNRMEGGTLTRAETRSVMVQVIDVRGKSLKDVLEMTGHDKVISEILNIVDKSATRISEKRIKQIHQAIMYEPNEKVAKQIGVWKTKPNEIINYKGEKYRFLEPEEVKEAIHKLLNKLNADLDSYFNGKASLNPVILAAQFHIDFLNIHPFYDGNGRVARILSNIILISCGYPPVIVKEESKNVYYQLLAEIDSYGADVELLHNFFASRLIETQKLIIEILGQENRTKKQVNK